MTRPFGPAATPVPAIGQGTWNFPQSGAAFESAAQALRAGIELGLVHIDTAEMYGNGRAEQTVGEAIRGVAREALFIVSKVLPSNASFEGTLQACEGSLRRIGTGYLDAYLLHWRGVHPLRETLRAFRRLVAEGKIHTFGVSNFDSADLEEALADGAEPRVSCNQVLYHLGERGVERRLLPYCRERGIALVGYSPFGSGEFPGPRSAGGRVLAAVAERHASTGRAVALAFLTRLDGTFAIPKAARVAHVRDNASALNLQLNAADIAEISAAFPLPPREGPLATL